MDDSAEKNSALFIATLASFLTPFMTSAVNIALPSIGKEFFLNAILLSCVPTSYILAAVIFLVPFGRLADIYGRKRIFTYGIASGTLATMRLTGQMLGLGIAMLLFAVYIGRVRITPEYYPLFLKSAKAAFAIFAALCFGGIFASLARGKVR